MAQKPDPVKTVDEMIVPCKGGFYGSTSAKRVMFPIPFKTVPAVVVATSYSVPKHRVRASLTGFTVTPAPRRSFDWLALGGADG